MAEFEKARQRTFERTADGLLSRIDPATGLIPGGKPMTSGPHSMAAGWDVRTTAEAAVALSMTGHAELAWKSLSAVLGRQDTKPGSFTFGNFFWHSEWETVWDPNAASFIVPLICYVLRHRADAMPQDLRRRTEDALALATHGLNAHRASWEYTNIALLNIASKLLIADALDGSATHAGMSERIRGVAYWDWEEWRNHTCRLGAITEFNSLTYGETQIDALSKMLACRADESLLREVRAVRRHLVTSFVLDYHPSIGRITGPQSRAYPGARRRRGPTAMDTVLHFVLGTPEPPGGCLMWLGAEIGPEDILPGARNLSLPRTTRAATHGFARTNYLADDFALGSISGRARNCGCFPETPFFVAYRSSSPRCSIAFVRDDGNPPDAIFSCQRAGTLLAANVWLLARTPEHGAKNPDYHKGKFSGLNVGRPDDLVRDPDFMPGYAIELGLRHEIRILDGQGTELKGLGEVTGAAIAIETESVCVGMRFVGSGGGKPALTLSEEEDGETVLTVRAQREGRHVSDIETAAFCGFLLEVAPGADGEPDALAREMGSAELRVSAQESGWRLRAPAPDGSVLEVDVPADPPCFYSVDGQPLTANQWALSLGDP